MPSSCTACDKQMMRVRRSVWQRLAYSRMYKCAECHAELKYPRHWVLYFSRTARCPRCGTERLEIRTKPDKLDTLVRTPVRVACSMLGGRLYHCHSCRLQFHDLRKPGALASSRQTR